MTDPKKRIKDVWDNISETDRAILAASIAACSVPARAGDGIMGSYAARLLFLLVTVGCFVLVFSLADRMPQAMVAAGMILSFTLAIITLFIWLKRPPPGR
jgi:hypothetical protein